MRIYVRLGPLRRPIEVDVDSAATVGQLRVKVGADALYLAQSRSKGHPCGLRRSVSSDARSPASASGLRSCKECEPQLLDDEAVLSSLVPAHATLTAAPRPSPRPRCTELPSFRESRHAPNSQSASGGIWAMQQLPTALVTAAPVRATAPAARPAPAAHMPQQQTAQDLAAAPELSASPPATTVAASVETRGQKPDAGPLEAVLDDDWEELSHAEEFNDSSTCSDSAWSLAGHIVQKALHSDVSLIHKECEPAKSESFSASEEPSSESIIFAWGDNSWGQCLAGEDQELGCRGPKCVPAPRQVTLPCTGMSLCCGGDCSLLVSKGGGLWAGGLNSGGKLSSQAPEGPLCRPTSIEVPDHSPVAFVAAAAGRDHVLAVSSSGEVLGWGASNSDGQIGIGSDLVNGEPVRPRALHWPSQRLDSKLRIASIACGEFHSLVLTQAGELFAFGSNSFGQLGLGRNVQQVPAPKQVGGRLRGLPLRAVAAGARHSLVLSVSGAVFSWGSNADGCLGLGDGTRQMNQMKECLPAAVPTLPSPGCMIAAGSAHSAVVVQSRQLLLAGSNSCGQLGHRRRELLYSHNFRGLPASLALCVRSVALGHEHSVLLTFDGELQAFGRNSEGQCGVQCSPSSSVEPFVDTPTRLSMPEPFGRERQLVVWAIAAGRNHNMVLCSPRPEALQRTPGSLPVCGSLVPGRQVKPPQKPRPSSGTEGRAQRPRPRIGRRVTVAGLTGCKEPGASSADLGAAGAMGTSRTQGASGQMSPELRPVVQPGVAPCAFIAVGVSKLAALVAEGGAADGEHLQVLCSVLARPTVLNASFCYPGLRTARLDAAGLCRILAAVCARDEGAGPRLLDAAAEGLALLLDGPIESLAHKDQLRALAVYLCLPARRPTPPAGSGTRPPRSLLASIAHLVMRMPSTGRIALRDLLADECGDVRVLRDFAVPHVRLLADSAIRSAGQQPWLAGALWEVVNQLQLQRPLWEAVLLLQILASASEQAARLLRPLEAAVVELRGRSPPAGEAADPSRGASPAAASGAAASGAVSEAAAVGTSPAAAAGGGGGGNGGGGRGGRSEGSSSSGDSIAGVLVGPEGEDTGEEGPPVPPRQGIARAASLLDPSAFQLASLAEGHVPPEVEFWLFQEHAQFRQITPTEVANEPDWSDAASMLPRRFCSFMAHANLVPVAFKQRVLQVENVLRQRLSQERVLWPQAEMVLGGGRADPSAFYFMLSVNRKDLLRETFAQMYSASPVDLRRPLRVEFIGEEAVDEGGVMREFFRVLSSELFSPKAGLFFEADGSRRLWFCPTLGPGRQLEDYWMVGVIVALAVYNNHPGLDVPLPSVLFKKLKDEPTAHEDLAQLFPGHARSLEAILSWTPSLPTDTEAGLDAADAEFQDVFCLSFVLSMPSSSSAPSSSPGTPNGDSTTPPAAVSEQPLCEALAAVAEQPLCEGGASRPVLYRDRTYFAARAEEFLLHSSVQPQFESFARGFRRVCNSPLFNTLSAEELEAIVAGQTDLDLDSLRQGAQYEGFAPEEPYIDSFWQVLNDFPMPRRRRFLAFCTGSDVAPAQGLQDLRLLVQRHGEEPTSRLPVAHTCFNLLLLPRYGSAEKLRAMLITAVEWTEGFGLQ